MILGILFTVTVNINMYTAWIYYGCKKRVRRHIRLGYGVGQFHRYLSPTTPGEYFFLFEEKKKCFKQNDWVEFVIKYNKGWEFGGATKWELSLIHI